MRFKLNVTLSDGRAYVAHITPWVWVAWERRTKGKVANIATSGLGMEDMAFLAYEALKPAHLSELPPTFDSFVQALEQVEPVEDPETDPTPPVASAD